LVKVKAIRFFAEEKGTSRKIHVMGGRKTWYGYDDKPDLAISIFIVKIFDIERL